MVLDVLGSTWYNRYKMDSFSSTMMALSPSLVLQPSMIVGSLCIVVIYILSTLIIVLSMLRGKRLL